MDLKVVKYRNYGLMTGSDSSSEDEHDWHDETRFLFSFYELSNGKIHRLMIDEYWKGDASVYINFEIGTTYFKLKNGDILNYEFGMDFWEWMWGAGGVKDVVEYEKKPSKEEIDCVMEFYHKHVHEKREETQETITIQ